MLHRLVIYSYILNCCFTNEIKTKYIYQPLDHFDNSSKFKMLYFERTTYWKENGPILIYVNGEYEAKNRYLRRGGMVRLAIEMKGAMYVVEHRYYGKSVPNKNDYKYLNTKQVLADLANFIRMLKGDVKFRMSKVVLIGVSYSGNLASWARQKYPELVDAAWASSSPVLATFNYYEYYEHLGEIYKKYGGESCYEQIEYTFDHRENLLFNSVDKFKSEMNICPDVDLSKSIQKQVYLNRLFNKFERNKKPDKIVEFCEHINNSMIVGKCDPTKYDYFPPRKIIDITWAWQCCTEFGYFLTSVKPFGKKITLDYPFEKCKIFGNISKETIEKSIDAINKEYGGIKPNVSKVIFFNGGLDPWSKLGVLDNYDDVHAIYIENSGHGDDFKPAKTDDTKELVEARNTIRLLIKKWIF